MNVTMMERLDFQLFFNVITITMDALLHALWHFLYTLVIELSCHVLQVQGSIRTAHELSHANFQAFLAPLLQLFRPARTLYVMDVCMSYINTLTHFCKFVISNHYGP